MPSAEETGYGSILTIANLQVINDPSIQEYDSLQVSMELFLKLFPSANTSDKVEDRFVLIKFLGSPDHFHSFKLFKISKISDYLSGSMVVFINDTYLSQFSSRFTLTTALIQSVGHEEIPNLDDVFVAVPGEIYSILKNKTSDSVKNCFMKKYLHGSIACQDDLVREINGEIILCEPVRQGRVTRDTNIYFVKKEQKQSSEVDENIDQTDDINLSNYLSSSLNIDLQSSVFCDFKIAPLINQLLINNLPDIWAKEDSELFVFIRTKELARLGFPVFNGDSVYLNTGSNKLVVKIFTIIEPSDTFSFGTIYISPILLINLDLQTGDLVHMEPLNPIKDKDLQISAIVPLAKTVTISRIASPITLDKTYQQHFFSALKTSFNSSFKVVQAGDFIHVTIDSILSKTMFDLGQDDDAVRVIPTGDPDSVAWFKIVEVLGDEEAPQSAQFRIDPLKTRMILSGVEFTKIPKNESNNWYEYSSLPPVFNYNRFTSQGGSVFQYAKTLKKIISTNKNSKINLKTFVMLSSMSRGLGKTTLVRNLSIELGLNLIELDCVDFINPGSELKTIGLISGSIEKLLSQDHEKDSSFNIIYLKHIESLCPEINENEQGAGVSTSLALKLIQLFEGYFDSRDNIIFVFSTNDVDKVNNNLKSIVKFQIDFGVPNEDERLEIFKFLIKNETKPSVDEFIPEVYDYVDGFTGNNTLNFGFQIRKDVKLQNLALQSAGLTPRDLISIFKKSKNLAIKRLRKLSKDLEKLVKVGNGGTIELVPSDFNSAINEARNEFSDSIGAPRIPNVKWEDIGGLDVVKDEILDTIDMPLKHPELFNNGLKKRSGILFYGPPGTGKTLLAKAIATNFSLNFFSVKGPELLNMYIGESEANVRRVFQKARDAKPCVIFFDELDSVAPKRGNQGDSGGVMDRIVSQLLAELDGMSGGNGNGDGVFVVGATNRPDLLDEALLRPGRYDKMLYLGISDTNDKQVKILEALTRKFKLDDDVNLDQIAENCTFNFTGADFYALCSDSMLNAMTRLANEVDIKITQYNEKLIAEGKDAMSTRWWFDNIATEDDTEVVVKMVDFLKAQRELVPSVSSEELAHYLKIRQNFEGSKQKKEVNGSINNEPTDANGESNGIHEVSFAADISQQSPPNGTTVTELDGVSIQND
ncbi:peroxisomal assembly protein [Yamadazyma tenuis]|uniref:Peroxisomal ATPase PEX6 n=1 Tax=Candida tenuis (strain ATCC 10573 / BCRC 21748 / CBS 615 / JCM 9827 / NBRC 10315 / NRRL Y-1498 / VKM Y-70) TaxID=590646 RepID=G3AWQ9_CANTC|nr:uncharacterized protein CANTEDRAFT_117669 [Yamadazyma tenuis ATCC 10573]EGV66590.1 hypothetical protein CANTEDRAFT_117669 [Yamadazyma tenuis ATCC 10573]WEJ95280.1 peroxisomal assembly protein [Yamadazyma tenuis]